MIPTAPDTDLPKGQIIVVQDDPDAGPTLPAKAAARIADAGPTLPTKADAGPTLLAKASEAMDNDGGNTEIDPLNGFGDLDAPASPRKSGGSAVAAEVHNPDSIVTGPDGIQYSIPTDDAPPPRPSKAGVKAGGAVIVDDPENDSLNGFDDPHALPPRPSKAGVKAGGAVIVDDPDAPPPRPSKAGVMIKELEAMDKAAAKKTFNGYPTKLQFAILKEVASTVKVQSGANFSKGAPFTFLDKLYFKKELREATVNAQRNKTTNQAMMKHEFDMHQQFYNFSTENSGLEVTIPKPYGCEGSFMIMDALSDDTRSIYQSF